MFQPFTNLFSSVPSHIWSAFGSLILKLLGEEVEEGAEWVLLGDFYLELVAPGSQGHLISHCFAWSQEVWQQLSNQLLLSASKFSLILHSSKNHWIRSGRYYIEWMMEARMRKDFEWILQAASQMAWNIFPWLYFSCFPNSSLCLENCLYRGTVTSILRKYFVLVLYHILGQNRGEISQLQVNKLAWYEELLTWWFLGHHFQTKTVKLLSLSWTFVL